MERVTDIADRLAKPAMWLVCAAQALFVALSLLLLLVVSARAETSCGGKDMLAEFSASNPDALKQIEADAAKTPNGRGILWKIEKDGIEPSYLFGTFHVTDPRVTEIAPAARAAFDASNTIVIETTDILDDSRMMGILAKRPDLMMYTDAETLTSGLTPEQAVALNEGLEAKGIPPGSVAKMKPWMLLAMISLPACELARKGGGEKILDARLAADAKAAGKTIVGLESGLEQLEVFASLPMDFHISALLDMLKLGDRADDVFETMIVLYQREEVGMYWPLFTAIFSAGAGLGEGYAEFDQKVVTDRNKTMAERAAPLLDRGGAFVAVGALHLPGEKGLVELLRERGYAVSPAS